MPRLRRMTYVPLDVEFFDNARVLEAGEKSAWLYLNMLTRSKKLLTNGILSDAQMNRLQVPGWKNRLKPLIQHGLIERLDDTHYLIIGFLERNLSAEEVAKVRAKDRARKGSGTDPDSDPDPDGFQPESDGIPRGPLREVEGEGEDKGSQDVGDVDQTTHQTLRLVSGDPR